MSRLQKVSANDFYTIQSLHTLSEQEEGITAQPFLLPLSGVCENTPCFLGADCCGTLKRAVVNSFYRITSRPVKLCVALSRPVTILVGVPAAKVIKCAVVSLTLPVLGIYVPPSDRPFGAKNISHAHRAGKCAKHFLLLETSASQSLSRFFPSFSPRPFYSPFSSLPLLSIPRSIPLSLSFLPPHLVFFFIILPLVQGLLTLQPMTRCQTNLQPVCTPDMERPTCLGHLKGPISNRSRLCSCISLIKELRLSLCASYAFNTTPMPIYFFLCSLV